jgi:shikimate 5-dehydrogenase
MTCGGLEMLLGQAAAAFVQWTGQPMPLDPVRKALERQA